MSLSKDILVIETYLNEAKAEILKLEANNKSSGSRARKQLQQVKAGCHELRKSIMVYLSGMETKKRTMKIVDVNLNEGTSEKNTKVAMETTPEDIQIPKSEAPKPTPRKRTPKKKDKPAPTS